MGGDSAVNTNGVAFYQSSFHATFVTQGKN